MPVQQSNIHEAARTAGRKTIRILGVGNSFLRNATEFLPAIVQAAGHEIVLRRAAPGGWTLERHHAAAMAHEADPDDPIGRPYLEEQGSASLKEMLLADQWDFVTIQQASPSSFTINTYRPHAQNLRDYIRTYAPQAEVVLHQTWAYREDSRRLYGEGFGPFEMYQGLTRAYHTIAKEVGIAKIIPVGNAFRLASELPDGRFKKDRHFDHAGATYPNLPVEENSLNTGYYWILAPREAPGEGQAQNTTGPDDAVWTLRLDAQHANAAGKYLGACVWFEFFYKEDARCITFTPSDISAQRAGFLRETAHRVVAEAARPVAWPQDLGRD